MERPQLVTTSIVLFNRDLRVHDHEGLRRAGDFGRVIPLFVLDDALRDVLTAAPNRARFLVECLDDLDAALRERGAPLVIRCGDPAAIVAEYEAEYVFASADYTPVAQRREAAVRPTLTGGIPVVAPGVVTPTGGDRYKVFTPYWNRWKTVRRGKPLAAPRQLNAVDGLGSDDIGWLRATEPTATDLAPGGETAARDALTSTPRRIDGYADKGHDDLAGDRTSRLSQYLHFGCISAREVCERMSTHGADGDALIRQLCWRDFFLQYEALEKRWPSPGDRPAHLQAWEDGRTGYPLVDAGMRQLRREGWMHNRARMVTASFLVKDLQIDWRFGAAHFMRHLVDTDVAQNNGNWKWVAGIGTDTRPDRAFNPLRQQERFDKRGDYIRRYVEEFGTDDYPEPIIDESELASARARRR
jgi:deoxyribodipyrimidine photo-lyase